MPYIPHTKSDTDEMLKTIGVERIEDLFDALPSEILANGKYDLPAGLSEQETRAEMTKLAEKNRLPKVSFMGGGFYHHYIPSHVAQLIGRSEFYTAYTPYQPEISQGILQAIFEYQTLITRLTAMDATNASMYDGSSATGEVCLMASAITNRRKILMARSVHPEYREVMQTYCDGKDLELIEVPFHKESGRIDANALMGLLTDEIAGFFIQSPNVFGVVEAVKALAAIAHQHGAVAVQVVTEALSLGLLTPPGENDIDIVVGEGQSFGLPVSGGGPTFGFLATKEKYLRRLPGRIVGETEDVEGKKAYVLTLQAREQHIRREKASSNICTNQTLCATMGAMYLASLGKKLKDLALLNHQNSVYFQKALDGSGVKRTFVAPFFNEFVVNVQDAPSILKRLRKHGIAGGIDLGKWYPELKNHLLICVTELITKTHMEKYLEILAATSRVNWSRVVKAAWVKVRNKQLQRA